MITLVWDVTIADTTAMLYISVTSQSAGSAAEHAANRKRDKFVDMVKNHLFEFSLLTCCSCSYADMLFVPIAVVSRGPFVPKV